MAIDIKVPSIGESITEVTLIKWMKKSGEWVERDEILAELESEKATFEINAEKAGILTTVASEGDTLKIGDIACKIDDSAAKPISETPKATANEEKKSEEREKQPVAPATTPPSSTTTKEVPATDNSAAVKATPVASAMLADKKLDLKNVTATGSNGRILKHDVLEAISNPGRGIGLNMNSRDEKAEKMSNLRKTISRRLVEAKNTTAMLTTFNEVDMSAIMEIRAKNKDPFKTKHGVNLGFMSFFTKAVCFALQEWPSVNAKIDAENIIYHNYCDISIAVSAPKGLVVPVIRNAESMSMAEIEKKVVELATKAKENKLTIEEMTGGTFTLTNGGIFGSLMSTPIINIPQSAILGMHKIQERPMVVNGAIVIKPMMYLALSYDHRIIDGRESVSFLVRVKEMLENPGQLLIGKDPVKTLLEM